jgi:hypothetical protein
MACWYRDLPDASNALMVTGGRLAKGIVFSHQTMPSMPLRRGIEGIVRPSKNLSIIHGNTPSLL